MKQNFFGYFLLIFLLSANIAFSQQPVGGGGRTRTPRGTRAPILQNPTIGTQSGTVTTTMLNNNTFNTPGSIVVSDTTLLVDTVDIDGINIRKMNNLRRISALKSEKDIKEKAAKSEKATSADASKKKNELKTKVLSNGSSPTLKNPINTAVLSMPDLREDDATYNQYVWREIDAREKMNHSFIYKGKNQQAGQSLYSAMITILKQEVLRDETSGNILNGPDNKPLPAVIAFESEGGDDFIKPMILDSLDSLLVPKIKINYYTINGQVTKAITSTSKIPASSVYTFDLKEQYIFDKKYGQLFRRIIAIAPVALIPQEPVEINTGGVITYQTPLPIRKVLFWVNYDDIRPYLSKYKVYNPLNIASQMSWSDVLDLGYFNATIYKTTIDNENDRTFKELFRKDNAKRLEYAEKMKQKIFDQEQDRWVY